MASTYDIVKDAKKKKLIIKAVYDGRPREMCPHEIGTKDGVQRALFFQFGGLTSKGPVQQPGEWKCMDIDRLSRVTAEPGTWHTGDSHLHRQHCIDDVDHS